MSPRRDSVLGEISVLCEISVIGIINKNDTQSLANKQNTGYSI